MNYRYVMSVAVLSVLSLSVAASEKDAKRAYAALHQQSLPVSSSRVSPLKYTVPVQSVLGQPLSSDPLSESVRIGVMFKLHQLGVLPRDLNVGITLKLDLDWEQILKQLVEAQKKSEGAAEATITVDISINKLEVTAKNKLVD